MAHLSQDPSGNYHVRFNYGGKEFRRSLKTKDASIAESGAKRVEETLMRLERGWLTMPSDADPGIFIASGGERAAKTIVAASSPVKPMTLGQLHEAYKADLPADAKEGSTRYTEGIHLRHLTRILGTDTPVESIGLKEAQRYAAKRAKQQWREKPISGATIKKELKTLRIVWAWGSKLGHLQMPCPWNLADVDLNKDDGREPFRTLAEITQRIERGGLTDEQQGRLWECLYLTGSEITEVLAYVEAASHKPARYVYPLVAFVALTGARRSEVCRSQIDDFDFANNIVHIREKKRDKSKRSTLRHVPLHPVLRQVMSEWFANHPGGQMTLAQDDGSPVSVHLAYEHFKMTLAKSERWRYVRGFHTFRHSFASILACKGIDQRIIDALMGHQTEEMRARYQHLFPHTREQAIAALLS
jgi:integrase